MKINGNAVKIGMIIKHNDRLWKVTKTQHTQPGKGGAYLQAELKDIKTGSKSNDRFRSSENIERIVLEQKKYQFLYLDDSSMHFMDLESFEQIAVNLDILEEEKRKFLQDGMEVEIETFENDIVNISLPITVVLTVLETEDVIKGQTVSSSYKPAILENNIKIMVPPHIYVGTKIVVNTEDCTYSEKAK